jgi:dipeptidyl aminopeptidase/acylaminoacyl peptidase
MRRIALALALLASPSLRSAEAPAIANYFGNDLIDTPRLSADGNKIAYLTSDGTHPVLAAFHLDTQKGEVLAVVDVHTTGFAWKGNDRIIYLEELPGDDILRSITLGKHELDTFPGYGTRRRVGGIHDWLPADPGHLLVIGKGGIGRLDLATAAIDETQPTDRLEFVGPYIADAAGTLRLRCVQGNDGIELQQRRTDRDVFATVHRWTWEEPTVYFEGFGADGRTAYLLTPGEGGHNCLRSFDPEAFALSAPLAAVQGADIKTVLFSRDRSKLLGLHIEGRHTDTQVWLEPRMRRDQAVLDASLPNRRNWIESWSDDLDVVVALSCAGPEPGTYYSLDLRTKALRPLGRKHPAVELAQIGRVSGHEVAARDGLTIHTVLTLPPGPGKGPFPLLVVPQGEPFAGRFLVGYSPLNQSLASQGYAVLDVDYRGAHGYGLPFEDAGRLQIAAKIPDDIEDATRWAVQAGYAVPGRIGLYGEGLGATLALVAATHTPELYCCVVNSDGQPDFTQLSTAYAGDFRSWLQEKREERFYGSDTAAMARLSPLKAMDRLPGPVLSIYEDPVHDLRLAALESALRGAHKRGVEFVILPPDPHWAAVDYRLNYVRQVEDFLNQNLKAPFAAAR